MEQTEKKRNQTLDAMRLFAAFLIVGLHVGYPSYLGGVNQALSRVGVPFFFMLSGYFYFSPDRDKRIQRAKKGMLHLLKIALIAYALTWLYFLSFFDFNIMRMAEVMNLPWSPDVYLNFFVFNDPSGFFMLLDPMWFLPAMLYAYGVLFLMDKIKLGKARYIVMIVLLLALLYLSELSTYLGIRGANRYYRNFLMTGVPFMLFGSFIHEYKEKFTSLPNYLLFGMIVLGAAYAILMQWFFVDDFFHNSCEISIGTIAMVVGFVCLGVKYPNAPKLLSNMGRKYSLTIYVVHPIVISLVRQKLSDFEWYTSTPFQILNPLLVFLISLLVAVIVSYVQGLLHKLKRAK